MKNKTKKAAALTHYLTPKQEAFCCEYIIDNNGTKAAKRAGYSEKTAGPAAARLLKNVNVVKKINALSDSIKSTKIATAAEIQATLSSFLRNEESEDVVCVVNRGGFLGSAIKHANKKISIKDRIKAAEALAKIQGINDGKTNDAAAVTEFYLPAKMIAPSFVELNMLVDELSYNEYVCKGGRGSGKSSYISEKIPELLINNPQMHACVVRKVAGTLRDSVYAQLKWSIIALGLEDKFTFTVSPLEITYNPTGQKIFFRGADDPAKIKSIKPPFGYIGVVWFEELDQFSGDEECRNIQQSALRGTDEAGHSKAFIFKSFNPPPSAQNWANKYVLTDKPGQYVHHSTYLTVPKRWLGQVFVDLAEVLKEKNEKAYRNEYLGEVTGTGGAIFPNVIETALTAEQIAQFANINRGLDWGFALDPTAYIENYYDKRTNSLYMFNELYEFGISFDALSDKLQELNPTHLAIYAESADPRSNNEMNKRGHCFVPVRKGAGSVEHGIKWLQSLNHIYIDPTRTPRTFTEFSSYEYQKNKDGEFISAYPDKNNHAIDATRYSQEINIIVSRGESR